MPSSTPTRDLYLGALAGLVGGLVFGAAMMQLGLLLTVALLVRADSPVVGFVLHMMIAAIIGAGFGLLVRHQHPGAGETLFWGLSYDTFWWVLGPLTLLPLFLGGVPQWTAQAAASFATLVGHLAYGAALGVIFYGLEARYSPWWVAHTKLEATRVADRKEQVLAESPALWLQIVIIALTLPLLLGG